VWLELAASVVAPLVAFAFASEDCLRDVLFPTEATTTVAVPQQYCTGTYSDGGGCAAHGSYSTSVSYTAEFEFDGERCVSSVITLYTPAFLVILALRLLVLAPAWWLTNVHRAPWILAGTTPPRFLATSFLAWRPARPGAGDAAAAAALGGGHRDRPHGDSEDEERRVGDGPAGTADGDRHSPALALLHSLERDTFAINCVAIATCPGVLSPVISLAAFGCLLARPRVFAMCEDVHAARTAGRERARGDRSPEEHSTGGAAAPPLHQEPPRHPLPPGCVAALLVFQTLYVVLFLVVSDFVRAAVAVVVVNWTAFAALLLHHRRRPAARGGGVSDPGIGIGMVELASGPDDRALPPASGSTRRRDRGAASPGSSLTERLLCD